MFESFKKLVNKDFGNKKINILFDFNSFIPTLHVS